MKSLMFTNLEKLDPSWIKATMKVGYFLFSQTLEFWENKVPWKKKAFLFNYVLYGMWAFPLNFYIWFNFDNFAHPQLLPKNNTGNQNCKHMFSLRPKQNVAPPSEANLVLLSVDCSFDIVSDKCYRPMRKYFSIEWPMRGLVWRVKFYR